jgi:hypothetical protein
MLMRKSLSIVSQIFPSVLFVLLSGLQHDVAAQSAIIRGIVSDFETGQTLPNANVVLELLTTDVVRGTQSDANGLYQFGRVENGRYALTVRYVGYETFKDTLWVNGFDQQVVRHAQLRPTKLEMDELVVSGSFGDDIKTGQIRITPVEIRRIPTPGANSDLVGYIQSLPGVGAMGDRGGQLFVRGGTSSENMVLVDGSLIYQPFHILGFYSVFPEDVVSSVDFHAGGFGPRYSGFTSSVLDVRLKNGNLYHRKWAVSVSPFISDIFLESPISKGKSSLMLSLRGSLIEPTSEVYLNEKQPLTFNSQLLKVSAISQAGVNCTMTLIRTYDRGRLSSIDDDYFKWMNIVNGTRCSVLAEYGSVSHFDFNFGLSYFDNRTGKAGLGGDRMSRTFKSHIDINLTQYVGDVRLDYGFFTNYNSMKFDISDLFVSINKNDQTLLTSGGYLGLDIPVGGNVSLSPGFSYTNFLRRFKHSLEPRFQASWKPRGIAGEEFHAAAGIYRQVLVGITDYRDAGTAFTAWMMVPEFDRRMEGQHVLVGWRQPIGRELRLSVEAYHKRGFNVPVSTWSTVAQFSTDIAYADALISGMDINLNVDLQRLYFSAGYGFADTEYTTSQEHFTKWFGESVQRYLPAHARKHQLNAKAGYELGRFRANASWSFGSGLPFTRPMGFDSYFGFDEQPPDVRDSYGQPRVLMEKPFLGRLPDFHRLDVSVEQGVPLDGSLLKIQAGAVNMYDAQNYFFYDIQFQRGIKQLPLVPYVSVKWGNQ